MWHIPGAGVGLHPLWKSYSFVGRQSALNELFVQVWEEEAVPEKQTSGAKGS